MSCLFCVNVVVICHYRFLSSCNITIANMAQLRIALVKTTPRAWDGDVLGLPDGIDSVKIYSRTKDHCPEVTIKEM